MSTAVKALIALAALAFVAAVFVALTQPIMNVTGEGLSRASSNLSLIAIALALVDRSAPRAV